ncbi:hypothetical protein BWK59_03975 [Flavobacterium davisii]|uniref:Outer membrane protein beta-barrel domain-containing protein n=1 Tax=Flavobacterium davisii TaxID=2906077 RepID=A0A246GK71_9FLAO|nr:outer membrane beta-barrel protein [Flavobacterium davisii]OWP84689.1 hypothetical protein BWK59_03975 [Flavobacterium davisii]
MIRKFMLLGAVVLSLATNAQDSKRGFYLKAGGSYFIQTVGTEFPVVSGLAATNESTLVTVSPGGVSSSLVSKESITGSFGEGSRTNLVAGFRFSERLGVEMGVHYYMGASRTMAERHVSIKTPVSSIGNFDAVVSGKIRALDLSPSVVLYLGEVGNFEPYTKVGVILPVFGDLTIKSSTKSTISSVYASNPAFSKYKNSERTDVVKPNPTLGFMASVGTSYKIAPKLSAYAEIEYRNFTVNGKTKETTEYVVEGVNQLSNLSYSESHTNYISQLNASSNNVETNPTGFDSSRPKDELSSYVGISGIGLSLGMRYNF